ncbi:phosphoribosylamine--glycine ligase [Ferrimicrobium sp.]|uniref:phosphoribosylamine--glycine ligase n=1 Tax=Ferrimicrobium sp. TaxID=2926050 RepID=UPI0026321ADE|nr:phosphoribosylamine--glycine ligase [Ferrimicrobium sp.]
MRIVVVGQGAREHAFARNLSAHHEVIVTPGNAGMRADVEVSSLEAEALRPDLVVIGPEAPLVDGLADRLLASGINVLGPGAAGAQLEGSKAFLKQLCAEAKVPTAAFGVATSLGEGLELFDRFGPPYVIKTDGLAAGKGVLVTSDRAEAEEDLAAKLAGLSFGEAGTRVVIEEGMQGRELSVFALCNGRDFVLLPSARDYKRLGDGDRGPNTGGMGSISPVEDVSAAVLDEVGSSMIAPTLERLTALGIEYRGILYAGVMLTDSGPKLVEYNVRFGDPEAEVVLPRITGGLAEALMAAALGEQIPSLRVSDQSAITVVLAAAGYPENPERGATITGIEAARSLEGVFVFGAGVASRGGQPPDRQPPDRQGSDGHGSDRQSPVRDGELVTNGGRVLAVTGLGATLAEARSRAYRGVDLIDFDGLQYRRDIGS